jgi:hypothetical protein
MGGFSKKGEGFSQSWCITGQKVRRICAHSPCFPSSDGLVSTQKHPNFKTMNDSELDELLRSADQQVPVPESFRHKVWYRIESASLNERKPLAWLDTLFSTLARPVGAVAAVTTVGLLGLWMGAAGVSGGGDSKLAYVESVSPFASAHK